MMISSDVIDDISPELQQLIDKSIAVGNKMAASKKFRYQLHIPRLNQSIGEDQKPQATLWTSTAIPNGKNVYTSEWGEWCHYNAPKWLSKTGQLYQIQPGARILNIGSDQAAIRIAKLFGRNYSITNYERLGNYPWKELSLYFDAIRYPARLSGKYSNRLKNFLMSLWDVESTAWYNTDKLKLVGDVTIKVRGW